MIILPRNGFERYISKKKKREKIYKKTYLVLAINQIERARGGRGDSRRAVLKYARFPACTRGRDEARGEEGEKRKSKIPRRNNPWDNLDP